MNRADTQQFGRRACQDFLLSRNILDCVASGFPDAILPPPPLLPDQRSAVAALIRISAYSSALR
jgi:hypothetical protein